MTGEDLLERRAWREARAPDDVRSLPTMLADEELALLYTLARDYASGEGAIVDAGCFLGGSSAALLAGVRDRPAPWNGPHVVHEGDIAAHGWSGGPIEVLFLDVLKSPAINDAVVREFFPHVVPGRTLIVHQDYEWGQVPWLHITVELMRDSLRWIDAVPYCTHMFLVERPIPAELLETSVWHDLDADEKVRLMDRAVESNSGRARGMAELSKVVLLAHLGRLSEALQLLESVGRRYDDPGVIDCGDRIRTDLRALELPRAPRSRRRPQAGGLRVRHLRDLRRGTGRGPGAPRGRRVEDGRASRLAGGLSRQGSLTIVHASIVPTAGARATKAAGGASS